MANNLKDHLKEVADAIRAKKGTSDLINPQDFSTEIKSIESGGTESSIEYLDIRNLEISPDAVALASIEIKAIINDVVNIVPMSMWISGSGAVIAIKVDFTIQLAEPDLGIMSIAQFIIMRGAATQDQLDAIPRITKEQFYDLNA